MTAIVRTALFVVASMFCGLSREVYAVVMDSGNSYKFGEFKYCMRQSQQPNLRECIGRSAISFLQRFDERENVTLVDENFMARRTDKLSARSLVNLLDMDPVDFRGIMENAGAVFSQRSLEWHMDGIYPGLMLKIGPSADARSVLEFALDPSIDERNFGYEEPSTARILTKQYLLPFLLGLKFNLVALVPLLFAGICLLLKKTLFFAKLALYVSSLLGVGGVAGALGSAGAFSGGLGGLAGVGGLGGLGGLFAGGRPPILGHPHSLDGGAASAGVGNYFPGKTTVFNHYGASASDEFHHASPYKRTDRKLTFDKPREFVSRTGKVMPTTPAADHFYDYEKQVLMMQDRDSTVRTPREKLAPSAALEEDERLGWKVVDVRT